MSGILAMMLPKGGKVTLLSNDSVTASVVHPSTATAIMGFAGSTQTFGSDGSPYTWLTGALPGSYEVNATLNSGAVTGTFGSWLNLGSSQSWSLTRSSIGTNNGNITLQIRPVGGSVVASGTVSFSATVT